MIRGIAFVALLRCMAPRGVVGSGDMADMVNVHIDPKTLKEESIWAQFHSVVGTELDIASASDLAETSPPTPSPTAIHGTVEYNTDKDLSGEKMWLTSVGVGNTVVGLPYNAGKVVVYDLESKTVEYNTDKNLSGDDMWCTSVGVGNKIVGLPHSAGKVVVYDLENKTVEYNTDGVLSGSEMWRTSVGVGNKIVGLPYNAGIVVVYDLESKTVEYNTDKDLSGQRMWRTSVGVGNKIVGLPYNAGKVVVYDLESETVEYNTDKDLSGQDMWRTSVGVGNKIVGLPYSADKVVVYDVEAKTVEYNTDKDLSGTHMWVTSVGVGNKIVGLPWRAGKVVVYDVESKTVEYNTDEGLSILGPEVMWFTSVGVGNTVVGLPQFARKVVVYDVEAKTVEYNTDKDLSGDSMWLTSVGVGNTVVGLPWKANKVLVFQSAPTTAPTIAPVLADAGPLTLETNSLGGAGGLMRFSNIANDGTELVVENTTAYIPFKANVTGLVAPLSSLAQISLGCGDTVELKFEFILDSQLVSPSAFNFTVADLDMGAQGRCSESVEMSGWSTYFLYPDEASSSVEKIGNRFAGQTVGSVEDNPVDIFGMTTDQKMKAVTFLVESQNGFNMILATNEAGKLSTDPDVVGYNGRRILFGIGKP